MTIEFNMPKISFIITCYNKALFIRECLMSIKEQSYENKEIIVVDDCSTDNSLEVIKSFKADNDDIKVTVIENSTNKGQLYSFIEGIKAAEGEFVTITDGDDVLLKEFAQAHIKTHLETAVALTTCRQIEIDENNVIHSFKTSDCPFIKLGDFSTNIKFNPDMFTNEFEKQDFEVKFLNSKKFLYSTWHWSPSTSAVMRKSVCDLLTVLNSPEKMKITADKFLFSFAHLIGSSAIIDAPLYAYRRHSNNYSEANKLLGSKKYLTTKTQRNYIRNNFLIRQEMLKFFLKNKKEFKNKFNHSSYCTILYKIIFSFDLSTLKSALKSLWV